ncbi:hypothetical protein BJ878DRAFT_455979 [Calycina marina]|uniref:ARM repeat superfamily protein n=1 Tax=Calycina marina TaxID=1763456 RepID=A0A9P7Z7W9_9HELO|nr:hypothetical protein BJ878DRAFT_455979 [Calycina marina]
MPVKSGRIIKTKKTKGGTQHQKNHRWESFASKESKLHSLAPIRRVRRQDTAEEDLSTSTSYLKSGLERWQELNTSEDFLNLNHELQPLCDSLPQILHFEDKIMDLLSIYLQKYTTDKFAGEAMSFLVQKAAAPANRALALPLIVGHAKIDLMSIQRTRQSSLYYHGLMTLFAQAIKGHRLDERSGGSVHTSGPEVLRALFAALDESDLGSTDETSWKNVINGVLTSVVHHTDSSTFKGILEVLLDIAIAAEGTFAKEKSLPNLQRLLLSTRMMGIAAGVRKGSRVEHWSPLLQKLSSSLKLLQKESVLVLRYGSVVDIWQSFVLSVAISIQYAPLESLIPCSSKFMECLTKDPFANCFLPFCSYISESAPEKYRSLVKPFFEKFVVAHWSDADNGDTLCVLLPKMVQSGALPDNHKNAGFRLPQSWQDQIVSKFEGLEVKPFPEQVSAALYDPDPSKWVDRCLPKYNALLDVLNCTSVHLSTNPRIAEILLRKLKLALRPDFSAAPEEAHFIVGRGFSAILRMNKGVGGIDKSLRPLLHAKVADYGRLPDFLQALLAYEKSIPQTQVELVKLENESVITTLVSNLSTASKELRLLSLRLLEHFHNLEHISPSESISLMIRVEQTPLDLESGRVASMCIRKLATLYSGIPNGSWLRQTITAFCFGMLTVKFSQLWDDASVTLSQISQALDGEKAVAELAFTWLDSPSWKPAPYKPEAAWNPGLTDFECSNMMKLDQLAETSTLRVTKARDAMLQSFAQAQQSVDGIPPTARSQALRLLSAAPALAEKRSRKLVPMFLSWADRKDIDGDEDLVDTDVDSDSVPNDWSRQDQKSLLDLFGSFTNSRSLYRSDDVYQAMLQLLVSGDLEIQKSALKAVLTWKYLGIKPYEENLLRLLDEDRFKEEVSILLEHPTNEIASLQGQTLVKAEHRAELNPVLLRLLYGRIISRRGIASGRQGPEARRLTVLRSLSIEDFKAFLDIALGDLTKALAADKLADEIHDTELMSASRQTGLMNMVEAVVKELGTNVKPLTEQIVGAVMYCLVYSSRQLHSEPDSDEEEPSGDADTLPRQSNLNKLRTVRRAALKCLNLLFVNAGPNFDWSSHVGVIVQDVIAPRLYKLPIETAEGISGLLRLFYHWSDSATTVAFLMENQLILPKVAECLSPPKSKDEVKKFVLSIIGNLVKLANAEAGTIVKETILSPNMDHFLTHIGVVLRSKVDISKDLLEACVETVSELAPLVSTSTQAHSLVSVSIFLLDQPSRRVPPKTKGGLLRILEHFVPLYDLQNDDQLKDTLYTTVTRLFGFFTDRASREVLSRVLMVYSAKEPIIAEVAQLCMDLNSFSEGSKAQLGRGADNEPDFDRRVKAYNTINAKREKSFSPRQWTPLLYNMLFYIRNDEALSVLSMNSSDSIRQFIDTAAACASTGEQAEFKKTLSVVLIPAIMKGAREPSERVRQEYLRVMGHLVRTFPTWSEVSDMHSLLAGDDEVESSFFNNILTVGKGRQSSALTQISRISEKGELSSKNVSQFFIPLIENFILDREENSNDAHNLAAEATTAIGVLAKSLEWSQYRALLRRFISYVKEKPELTKQIIRLLGRVTDALAFAAEETVGEDPLVESKRSALATTMPRDTKLSNDIKNIMRPLQEYLHDKDESTVSLRVPVAIIVVRLLKLLPQELLNELLPAVLTDICHIIRSKAQEARDMTRDTLAKICVLLGPSCFGFVLKELRGALARGSQLHILSYTMHSILVACTPEYQPGDLDYCLPSIVAIIMDDIFGATGQEKDAEEYGSKMKEVKSSKSHDSMELIARTATLGRLAVLVKPIQALLKEKLNIKMVRKIDELLNRISTGLLMNPAAASHDSLIFCYEVMKDSHSAIPEKKAKVDYKLKKYLIQKGAKKIDRGSTTVYEYKLVRFALDVLRVVLKKHDKLQTTNNLSGFVAMFQDALLDGEEEVKTSCFRLLTTIAKRVPLKYTDGSSVYVGAVEEATRSINRSANTTSDIAQAALKYISVVLRDRKEIPVKDKAVDDLLLRLKDDMTEPAHRHVIFNFLRAILDSKVETAVVYDTLDYVGTVMIQNPDKDTRKLARGAFYQFLSEYPQLNKRWQGNLTFIVDNLEYKGDGGRLSVLDLILLLLTKSARHEYLQEVSEKCFKPLNFVHCNDKNSNCKQSAAELLKIIFAKADDAHLQNYLRLLRILMGNSPVAALKIYGLYYEAMSLENNMKQDSSDVPLILGSITRILKSNELSGVDYSIQLVSALDLGFILVSSFPEILLSPENDALWKLIHQSLSYPDAVVKLSAAKLGQAYTTEFARSNQASLEGLPLSGSHGLQLEGSTVNDLVRRTANVFNTPELTADLAQIVYENLMLLGLIAGANNLPFRGPQDDDEGGDGEENNKGTTLEYLFRRLGYSIRKETPPPARAAALIPKTFALRAVEALANTTRLKAVHLVPCLETILLPLHYLNDDSIPIPYSTDEFFKADYETLKETAKGLMETLKVKVGTEEFSKALLAVRKGVTERRMQRSSKRKIEAVSMPERAGALKKKKVERKKGRRKEKGQEHALKRKEI